MELAESIKTAWKAVEESGVPDHMQELAFKEALRSLLGTAPSSGASTGSGRVPPAPQVKQAGDDGSRELQLDVSEEEVLQRVSDETGVPVDKLEGVFHIDGEVVKLIGPLGRYGSSTSDQARNVARIVTVVRKLGMGYADTPFGTIKDACESKHCYDPKNFASQHMPKIDGFVVKGEGRGRRLEVKSGGISSFPELIDKVLGNS
ncbi:hypothetical protein IOE58_11330 [Brachybacterium sp. Marseille-Q2903]|uniref:Uncharacterized protein n=1 Tax=Brachybacterium epidermidis TaxID=2781983 RepID=A0ABR9W2S2_9MICO|nr:hypothetical protein [Brachybacterium epidermidis]MBE9404747.1 hypothetical protein [Brachybacterium epidermidis]